MHALCCTTLVYNSVQLCTTLYNPVRLCTRDGIQLGLVTNTSLESRLDPEGTSPGRTRGYPDSDSHVPSPGTRHFWGGYKLLFLVGTLILHEIICTYVGYIRT